MSAPHTIDGRPCGVFVPVALWIMTLEAAEQLPGPQRAAWQYRLDMIGAKPTGPRWSFCWPWIVETIEITVDGWGAN